MTLDYEALSQLTRCGPLWRWTAWRDVLWSVLRQLVLADVLGLGGHKSSNINEYISHAYPF